MMRLLALLLMTGPVWAEDVMPSIVAPPAEGSVSSADGLAAWGRVQQVVSHPRCANCHVGPDHLPMWSGPEYPEPRPHGMAISGGDSRMGVETLPCATCHITASTLESEPRQAPNAMIPWHLPAVEMAWFGLDGPTLCRQLRDPDLNGGRDWVELAEHLRTTPAMVDLSPGGSRPAAGVNLRRSACRHISTTC